MVLGARNLSKQLHAGEVRYLKFCNDAEKQDVIKSLDMLGYDESAQEVYGCTYPEWKKRHQTKATDDQL
jgi:hypothetical protein